MHPPAFITVKRTDMNTKLLFLLLLLTGSIIGCRSGKEEKNNNLSTAEHDITGKWVRIGQNGPVAFNFKEEGTVEADFGNDQSVDAVSRYELSGDTIRFVDQGIQMCEGSGEYMVYQTDYYISLDLINDDCSGRVKTTMGFWTRPWFNDFLQSLESEIEETQNPELYLHRARIYLATGMIKQAKDDFDKYLLTDTLDARVYVNRAGTRFPDDLSGVISDCNRAISLDPTNKNAYFLRGLALYESGEEEQGCQDFSRAIELGFSVLLIAEQERCVDYWGKD
jgi:tetratricopeptide (TPR) repeat protein